MKQVFGRFQVLQLASFLARLQSRIWLVSVASALTLVRMTIARATSPHTSGHTAVQLNSVLFTAAQDPAFTEAYRRMDGKGIAQWFEH